MSVKERLKKFIESNNMTVKQFEESISASNGYVNSISKSIGIEKLEKIIEIYPNLNIEWLLAGKGTHLKNADNFISEPSANYEKTDNKCKYLIELLEYQKDEIKNLKKEVERVNAEKERFQSNH